MVLLDKILAGSCSSADRREFSTLLESNPELSKEYLEQMQSHCLLQMQSKREQKSVQLASLDHRGVLQDRNRRRSKFVQKSWLLAACLLIAALGIAWVSRGHLGPQSSTIAEILEQEGVAWSKNTTALGQNGEISTGLLELQAGAVTLQFRSGVTMYAIAPATLRIESDMLVLLDRGQASANVPKWATGFTIETPDVEVVDLGTKFGVLARDDRSTDVVVFEGEVDLKPSYDSNSQQTRLYQGEGVRVSNAGKIARVVEVRREPGNGSWSTDSESSQSGVIKSIRDNILSSSSVKYYEIVNKGFNEDARAYVDRVHEWNGLGTEGLPDFLKGIDYVRTFNDFKYASNLKIELELARPAVVYVFFDDRVPTPAWLTSQFDNTGIDIGLDEGPWSYTDFQRRVISDLSLKVAVGPGNSIEQKFSVWERKCPTPGTLILGPLGDDAGARAAYGIGAAALE